METLQDVVKYAFDHAAGFKEQMEKAGIAPENIKSPSDLVKLPVLKKDQLPVLQKKNAPFGNLTTVNPTKMARIFMSPGPIYDPQGNENDFWRFAEALETAGFSENDIVQNTFSYHLSPAGFMFDCALRKIGATVIPAGTGNRELQIQVMKDLQATGYVGTPSFFSILLDVIEEKRLVVGKDIHINKVFFTAEMVTADLRRRCEENGISVHEGYGTADCGCIAFEDKKGPGLRVTSSAIVQICDPHTGEEINAGEGEVVVTLLDKTYPLIRFGTGDLSRWVDGQVGKRIAGVLGRVSDGVKVRGMFVREKQLAQVLEEEGYPIFKGVVTSNNNQDEFEIFIESEKKLPFELVNKIQEIIRVRAIVTRLEPGHINREGKRIVDERLCNINNVK